MNLYAIRHRPTGRFIPHCKSGGSYAEPTDAEKACPRFFHRERDAKGFLTTWLRGPVRRDFSTDWETGVEEYDGLTYDPDLAKEPRRLKEWEVVTIVWRFM